MLIRISDCYNVKVIWQFGLTYIIGDRVNMLRKRVPSSERIRRLSRLNCSRVKRIKFYKVIQNGSD